MYLIFASPRLVVAAARLLCLPLIALVLTLGVPMIFRGDLYLAGLLVSSLPSHQIDRYLSYYSINLLVLLSSNRYFLTRFFSKFTNNLSSGKDSSYFNYSKSICIDVDTVFIVKIYIFSNI